METLVFIIISFCIVGGGLWCMDGLDRFLSGGAIHPYWDAEEERKALRPHAPSPKTAVRAYTLRLLPRKRHSVQ